MSKNRFRPSITKSIFGETHKQFLKSRIKTLFNTIQAEGAVEKETASKTIYHFNKMGVLQKKISDKDQPYFHASKLSAENTSKLVGIFNAQNESVQFFYKPASVDRRTAYRMLFKELGMPAVYQSIGHGVSAFEIKL